MKKEKRKRLTTQWSNLYVAITLFFVLGFGFFLSSKVFIADNVDILYTEVGKEFNLNNNGKFNIKEWIFDEKSSTMQITLITSGMTNYLMDLNFKAISRTNLKKELPTEIVYSSNDIYIIHISEVPSEFQQVALRLVKDEINFDENVDKKEEKDNIITSIYTDQNVVEHDEIPKTDVKEYAVKVTDEMISDTEIEIDYKNKEIEKSNLIIGRINKEVVNFKDELIYQTVDEQVETNNQIYSLEKQIEGENRTIETIKIDIESLNAKIERLIQRKRDLQY